MSNERLYFGNSRIASRNPGFSTILGVGLVLDQAAHAADCLEFRDPRHFRLDRRASFQRQAGDGAEHATVAFREPVDPLRFVEILRHVDVDFDEDQSFDLDMA